MSRLIGVLSIYLIMLLALTGIGLFVLASPARFGNLLHENLNLFPEVNPGDWGKKIFLRLIGLGMLAFTVRLVLRVVELSG